ncbi:MAG TPA: hypothetical protein VHE35_19615 [Kofleriaceae bacterium]|nr:hypothetical protein [Kofleriaceae bacterium]
MAAGCGTSTGGAPDAPPVPDDGQASDRAPDDIDAVGPTCSETIGDLGAPLEVRPVYVDHRSETHAIDADGAVELLLPPQGGHVLMVGLEARNVRGCTAQLDGKLFDPGTGTLLAEDVRPTQLLAGADGWGQLASPPVATSANLAVCPLPMLPRDVDGNAWRLELTITDDRDATATWSGTIVPFCRPDAPDPDECPCQCDADFMFGQPCPVDP